MVAVLFTLMSIIPAGTPESGCYDPKYTAYNDIVNQAINNCPNRKPEKVDRDLIWSLVVIEESFSPPPELRGMLLAAACRESGYDPYAKGDRKFSKKRKPKANELRGLRMRIEGRDNKKQDIEKRINLGVNLK